MKRIHRLGVLLAAFTLAVVGLTISSPKNETAVIAADITPIVAPTPLPTDIVVSSAFRAIPIYSDSALTQKTGKTLSTDYITWQVFNVVKGTFGDSAYNLGADQWVDAYAVSLVKPNPYTSPLTVSEVANGGIIYSSWLAYPFYYDPETTIWAGNLDAMNNEWIIRGIAKDASGTIVAYDLGHNQWVPAENLVTATNLFGSFATQAGTPTYNRQGEQTGTIATSGLYQTFGATYINNQQAIKLGTDDQWVLAADGAYYPN